VTEGEIDRLEARAAYVEDPVLAREMREHAAQLREEMATASRARAQ
jgi:hypothetical protein